MNPSRDHVPLERFDEQLQLKETVSNSLELKLFTNIQ